MKEDNNYSSEIKAEISYPKIPDVSINKNCSSYILQSNRDQNLYKKYELFLRKNKFHLNNNFDKNNAQIFLKEKNLGLANIDLDDNIEGEEEKTTIIEKGDNSYIKNHINLNIKNNNINKNINNNNINNANKNIVNNIANNKGVNKNENKKINENQSFDVGNTGCPPGSLFDTGKADLLCLLLGMTNK